MHTTTIKPNLIYMKNLTCFICFMFLLCMGCKKEEDPTPGHNYSGTLKMEYARAFPEFNATAEMDVNIYKSGDVIISTPDQVAYSGEDELEETVKINETGTVTITSLSGQWKVMDSEEYLTVNANTLIDGTQTIWGWDDEVGWVSPPVVTPFSVEDPVESPMNFSIDEAVIDYGAVLGATIPGQFGNITYKWTLLLVVQD